MFRGLGSYVKLGIPTTIMICLDWWVWELMIIITGYLGVEN
jgi:MATE family multidrug resistance protein